MNYDARQSHAGLLPHLATHGVVPGTVVVVEYDVSVYHKETNRLTLVRYDMGSASTSGEMVWSTWELIAYVAVSARQGW